MEKRKFLLWAGKQIGDTKFGGILMGLLAILGIIFPFINKPALEMFFNFQNSRDVAYYVLFVLFLIFILFLLLQLLSYKLIEWGKNTPPNIKLIPVDSPDNDIDFEKSVSSFFSSIKVINNEDSKITDCYVVLKKGNPISRFNGAFELTWLENLSRTIKWKNDENCKIDIGAWNGEATLRLYELRVYMNEAKILFSGFGLCGNNSVRKFPDGTYEFEIELHGEINGEEFKPISYVGFFDVITNKKIDKDGIPSIEIKPLEVRELRRKTKNYIFTKQKVGINT